MPVLNFKGKSSVYSHHLGVPFCSLEIDEKKSLSEKSKNGKKDNLSLNDNLIIHGDNLQALKALLPRYAGKVKCIYIDPPYNTGNEGWKYNDNMKSPFIKEWLGKAVGIDDLERHDKWLCMMWPRLQLLKELLSEDGVIFVSIDDNEQHRLRMIMDEIFGEQNFIGDFIWRKKEGGGQTDSYFVTEHEYILVYKKSDSYLWLDEEIPVTEIQYNKKDENGSFNSVKLAKWGNHARKEDRPKMHFPIKSPDNKNIYPIAPDGSNGRWRVGKARMEILIKDNLIDWQKKTTGWIPYEKIYFSENQVKKIKERSILYEIATTTNGANELKEIFGKKDVFENPKPTDIIKFFIEHSMDDGIILDSFAGSGTTAQAVLDLNKEDGGNRKFILVECEDYADKITAERVRRVIKGVPSAKNENLKKGLGGSFTYCTLGKEINEENLIKGKSLPTYKVLSSYVYYIATGQTLKKVNENKDFYIGKSDKDTAFFVIYKANIKFLRSKESALNLDRKEEIQKIMKAKNCKKAVVFAPDHYFESAGELAKEGILFCQLPFAIYKIAGV